MTIPTAASPPAETEGLFGRLPTGAKLFLILSVALMPLALIAVFAAMQTTRMADLENRAKLRVATAEAARTLGIEIAGDMGALRTALLALESDPADAPSCARTRGVFARGAASGVKFAVVDGSRTVRCGVPLPNRQVIPTGSGIGVEIVRGQGLLLSVAGRAPQARGIAFFPSAFLAEIARPSGLSDDYAATLELNGDELVLRAPGDGPFKRRDRSEESTGVGGLTLAMAIPSTPITSPVLIAMLLPLAMWVLAAGIGWFVVDRLLIRSLRKLRNDVGTFTPGTVFEPDDAAVPAHEIRELGHTFSDLSRTIRDHEADLADGLVNQTKLTREVHHRVKNNLQVITSLINFHARSAQGAEAIAAYATIQRRVDALAVVHRHHFAELEENRGLGLRSVMSELAANIRATASGRSSPDVGLTLEIEPYLVSQDVAVAMAFLVTELVELATSASSVTQVRISVKGSDEPGRATLRVSSPALIESELLRELLATRYGRVIDGLARQLRSKLFHDPLTGAFEIVVSVMGRD
jgi:two-component sensor histidine kinase